MLFFTVHKWVFYRDSKGKDHILLKGTPADTMSLLFPVSAIEYTTINAAQAALPSVREQLDSLL